MKVLLVALTALLAFSITDPLTGRWESKPSKNGNITGVVFKQGNRMEAYVNKKPFASGEYSFNATDSILNFVDNGCNGVSGLYKIMFYSNSDSLWFQLIIDSCEDRKEGMKRLVLGRVK